MACHSRKVAKSALSKSEPGSGAGGISSERDDGVSISYEGLVRGENLSDAAYADTSFGREYLQIRREKIAGFGSTTTGGAY